MKTTQRAHAPARIRRSFAAQRLLAALLLCLVLWSTAFAGPAAPEYRIYPLRNGVCKIAGNHAYHNGDNAETYEFTLFIWLILGGDKPMLVDAGISDISEMNRGAAHVLREPITQRQDETVRVQLGKFGLKPEDITIDAQLVTVDERPVPGAVLTLSQVGVVGQRVMQRVKTDEKGAASFLHNEFTLAHLAVRVAFAGDAQFASAAADAEIAIAGVEVPPAVPMSHAPGLVVKAALFSVLGAVWITYLFAASCIVRVVRDGRGAKGGETLRRGRSSAITP